MWRKADEKARPAFIAGAPKAVDPSRLPSPLAAVDRARIAADGSTNRRIVVASASTTAIATATPSSLHWVTGAPPARLGPSAPEGKITAASKVQPISFSAPAADKAAGDRTGSVAEPAARPSIAKGEWVIQIGAPDNAVAAAELLRPPARR